MTREQATEKLKKLKALAERGVGGEKETALQMYSDLKEKYGITDEEIAELEKPPVKNVKIEFSGMAFEMYVIAENLQEEREFCRGCMAGDRCLNCSTYKNIKDLAKRYEELKRKIESGGTG